MGSPTPFKTERVSEGLPETQKSPGSEKSPEAEPEAPRTRSIQGLKWFCACTVLYISVFVYGLDTTVAADVQSAVVEEFGAIESLAWLGTGFSMASVATSLPVGVLFRHFNTKWNFIAGVAIFELGSLVCGAAPTMNALIVGRVIAGLGGTGLYLGALNMLTGMTTERERGTYISAIGIFWGTGAVLGPVIGGAFSISSATWRWAFYINLIIAAVSAPFFLWSLPSMHPVQGRSIISRLATIDWVGSALYAMAWVLFAIVLTFGGSRWAWTDGRIIALWVVFGVVIIAFILQQRFTILTNKQDRIFPAHLLLSRSQVLLFVGTTCSATSMFTCIYYIPLYFQFVDEDSAITAAVRLLPFVAVAMSINFLTGALIPKIQYYAALYVVAGVFIVAGGAVLTTIIEATPISNIYGYSILVALGAGITVQAGYSLAAIKLSTQDRADDVSHGIALQMVAQIGGGTTALVIAGSVFQNYAFSNLSAVLLPHGFSTTQIQATVAGAQSNGFDSIDPSLTVPVKMAITTAMRKVFILVTTAGAVSAVSGLAMRWERLFG